MGSGRSPRRASFSLMARLIDRDAKLRHEIEAAMRRMAVGTYGVCTLSGESIGFERLKASAPLSK
jgi:RNA polymerase-binding transcription factor DksA